MSAQQASGKAVGVMPVAHEFHDHQARRLPHLIRLRMSAQGRERAQPPRRVVVEITRATGAVLAEAEAASCAALSAADASGHNRGAGNTG
jgi:hypothetical protein